MLSVKFAPDMVEQATAKTPKEAWGQIKNLMDLSPHGIPRTFM
jgi:hypothetical protein